MSESTTVAEIVTFRLTQGTNETEFLNAARGLEPLLAKTGAFISRNLSRDPEGLWTDHILWKDLASAKAAAESIMSDPVAMPFGSMIEGSSVIMRHAPIMLQME